MFCFQLFDILVKISADYIMLARLCYLEIVQLGFKRVNIILHVFALKHTLHTS